MKNNRFSTISGTTLLLGLILMIFLSGCQTDTGLTTDDFLFLRKGMSLISIKARVEPADEEFSTGLLRMAMIYGEETPPSERQVYIYYLEDGSQITLNLLSLGSLEAASIVNGEFKVVRYIGIPYSSPINSPKKEDFFIAHTLGSISKIFEVYGEPTASYGSGCTANYYLLNDGSEVFRYDCSDHSLYVFDKSGNIVYCSPNRYMDE